MNQAMEALHWNRRLPEIWKGILGIKSTSVGPHRDDICFMAGDLDIRRYGSQGQQRTAALSLKLSEIELVKQAIRYACFIADDVLSELDKHRQNYLLDSIHDIQT